LGVSLLFLLILLVIAGLDPAIIFTKEDGARVSRGMTNRVRRAVPIFAQATGTAVAGRARPRNAFAIPSRRDVEGGGTPDNLHGRSERRWRAKAASDRGRRIFRMFHGTVCRRCARRFFGIVIGAPARPAEITTGDTGRNHKSRSQKKRLPLAARIAMVG